MKMKNSNYIIVRLYNHNNTNNKINFNIIINNFNNNNNLNHKFLYY